jgi:large subunit ribosomal protein L24
MTKHLKSHIKIGDTVKIIAGNQKGLIGNITSFLKSESIVFVEGVLPRIKYSKNTQGGDPTKKELPISIHISNVMLWDKSSNSPSRVGFKMVDSIKKRYFKKSGNILEQNK